jgi:hypothetical protein
MMLVTSNTFGWLTAEIRRMSKRLAVITLSYWSRGFEFLPPDNTMAELGDLEYFAHIRARDKGDHKDRVFG